MMRIAISGERSIPSRYGGASFLSGRRTGSVERCRNCTIGLYGSGFTQEMRARMMMTHM